MATAAHYELCTDHIHPKLLSIVVCCCQLPHLTDAYSNTMRHITWGHLIKHDKRTIGP